MYLNYVNVDRKMVLILKIEDKHHIMNMIQYGGMRDNEKNYVHINNIFCNYNYIHGNNYKKAQ